MFSPSRADVLELVAAAIRAPSADNRHHVRFSVTGDGLALRADAFHLAGRTTHRQLLTSLSFGAVVENLRLALTRKGYDFEPHWHPVADDPALLLRLAWSALERTAQADPLAAAIDGRHTNRRFFRGPRLTELELDGLAAASETPGASLHWFDTSERRRSILRLMRLAETARFRDRALHAELFESIDFAAGWRSATTERLAPSTLEVEALMRLPFAALRRWPVMRVANGMGAASMLGWRAGDLPARWSPHVGAMATASALPDGALQVGRAFQRLWLATELAGLALQPMVASAILTTQADGDGLRIDRRDRLRDGWRRLVGDDQPLVVFRLGRAERPRIVSSRRPVADYID